MRIVGSARRTLGLAIVAICCATPSLAQATRTWVSGVGDDVNPCSRTAPCKTFAGAISKTAAGGEINAIDPGGYGAITITKSITIDGAGTHASIISSATSGVIVNAGAGDIVRLRNLSINGAPPTQPGLNGIRFLNGGTLFVENVVIDGFDGASNGRGIDFRPSGASNLFVIDSVIRNCRLSATGGGILIEPGVGGSARVTLDDVRLERNVFGIKVTNATTLNINDSVIAFNGANGITLQTAGGTVDATITNTTIHNNLATGLSVSGATTTARIGGVTVTGNATGLAVSAGGVIRSFGNNNVDGNATNGAPTSTPGQI